MSRENQERPGPQCDQRQHVEIDSIGARHGAGTVAFGLWGYGEHAGGQVFPEGPAKRVDIAARLQAQVDAVEAADVIEHPLRRGDVHQSQRLGISRFLQYSGHAQRLGRAADHDLQKIAAP